EGVGLVRGGGRGVAHACSSCPSDKHSGESALRSSGRLRRRERTGSCRVLERFWRSRGQTARFAALALLFTIVPCRPRGRSCPRSLPRRRRRTPRVWAGPPRRRRRRSPPCASPPPPRAPAPCAPAPRRPVPR